jgi:hypothetical protein
MLRRSNRSNEAFGYLDSAIGESDHLAELAAAGKIEDFDEDTTRQFQCASRLNKIRFLIDTVRLNESEALLDELRQKFPAVPQIEDFEQRIREARDELGR